MKKSFRTFEIFSSSLIKLYKFLNHPLRFNSATGIEDQDPSHSDSSEGVSSVHLDDAASSAAEIVSEYAI